MIHHHTPAKLLQPTPSPSNQSEYQSQNFNKNNHSGEKQAQVLDQIQSQMHLIQEKLKQIKNKRQITSPNTREYVFLEQQRRQLKKRLIDLDYQHEKCFELNNKSKNENQSQKQQRETAVKQQQNQIQSRVIQEQFDYSRKVQQELQKIQQASRQRQEEIRKIFDIQLNQQTKTVLEPQQESEAQIQRKLAEARYRSKVAELQLALASDALRRSRQLQLEEELTSLRLLNPLDWLSTLERPISYQPYYYPDPLALDYDPLIYPSYSLAPYL